mgnify:FL=1
MNISESISDVATSISVSVILGVTGGVMWLVRRVVTNQTQIDLLKVSLAHGDKRLDEIRDDMRAIRDRMDR